MRPPASRWDGSEPRTRSRARRSSWPRPTPPSSPAARSRWTEASPRSEPQRGEPGQNPARSNSRPRIDGNGEPDDVRGRAPPDLQLPVARRLAQEVRGLLRRQGESQSDVLSHEGPGEGLPRLVELEGPDVIRAAATVAPARHPLVDAAQGGHHSLLAREGLRGDLRVERLPEEEGESVEREIGPAEADAVPDDRDDPLGQEVDEEVRDEDHEGQQAEGLVL